MLKMFWNKNNISTLAGILAYAVTTLVLFIPTKGESQMSLVNWQSPMGITIIGLFVLSVALYAISIAKREKQLSYHDMKVLIEKRREYLEPLKVVIKGRLTRSDYLVKQASELPLEEYHKKYALRLKTNKATAIYSWIFIKQNFMVDNLYYGSLKDNDSEYRPMIKDYEFMYAQIKDRKLKRKLNGLWQFEHMCNSINIFALLSKNHPDIKKTIHGLRTARTGEKYNADAIKRQLNDVMTRIDQLLDGEEDE